MIDSYWELNILSEHCNIKLLLMLCNYYDVFRSYGEKFTGFWSYVLVYDFCATFDDFLPSESTSPARMMDGFVTCLLHTYFMHLLQSSKHGFCIIKTSGESGE